MFYASLEKAAFALIEFNFGFPPGGGNCECLARVAQTRTLEFIPSTDDCDASTAASWGMITGTVSEAELDTHVKRLAEHIGSLPVQSVGLVKSMVAQPHLPIDADLARGHRNWSALLHSPDVEAEAGRRIGAFMEAGGQTREGELDLPRLRAATHNAARAPR